MPEPLVSVIVPTKNSERHLERCLRSIVGQTHQNIELIVVDNGSVDSTKGIASRFTPHVFDRGPERSAEVNFGAARATGTYLYKVDSDFVLEPDVIDQCIRAIEDGHDAVCVHNTPDVSVSWIARVRKFEVDMYKFDLTHSSARFIRRDVFEKIGGYDEAITVGEDYDFQNRLNRNGFSTTFVDAEALHLGEPTSLWRHLRKYFEYGRDFPRFRAANTVESKSQLRFIRPAYVRNWKRFARQPGLALAFVVYSLLKFGAGGLGYALGVVRPPISTGYYSNVRSDLFEFATSHDVDIAGRVLNVGCGAGQDATYLRDAGATHLEGVEPTDAATEATTRYDRVFAGPVELFDPEGEFDLIVFADVLEHLVDPAAQLVRAADWLRPGGSLLISVPNVRHISVLWSVSVRGDWRYSDSGILDATHLRFFTQKSFRRLLAEVDYAIVAEEFNGKSTLSRVASRLVPGVAHFLQSQLFFLARPAPQ